MQFLFLFLTYESNISENMILYNEFIPFACSFMLIGLYYKSWINKLLLFTVFEEDSCLSSQEPEICRWLPLALNFISQFRCIVPLTLMSTHSISSGWHYKIIHFAWENHTAEEYHCVFKCYTGTCVLITNAQNMMLGEVPLSSGNWGQKA